MISNQIASHNINNTANFSIDTLVIVGVGLIGGSLALDLKRLSCVQTVIGIDISTDNLERAIERNVIDIAYTDIQSLSQHSIDMILIATPVATIDQIMQQLTKVIGTKTIITDVGSTKQKTLSSFQEFLPHHLAHCIATHPIAGSDRNGALAAQFSLFQQKKLIICSHEQQNEYSFNCIKTMWELVGAEVHVLDAQEHDLIFAAVSHLPHILSYAYMHQIANSENRQLFLNFAASGFRDFTRIAASHPDIWADICLVNKDSLRHLLDDYLQEITTLKTLLHDENHAALKNFFTQAKQTRDHWKNNQ